MSYCRVTEESARARIIEAIRIHPGESGADVASWAGMRRERVVRLLRELVAEGLILQRPGVGLERLYTLPAGFQAADSEASR